MSQLRALLALPALLAAAPLAAAPLAAQAADSTAFIRVNQLGYLPDAPKVAVVCALQPTRVGSFSVQDAAGRVVFGPAPAQADGPLGPCAATYRLDFSALRREGSYRVVAGALRSPQVRVTREAYAGAVDVLLDYMREQRSGFNPLFRDSVHEKTDAILVDHPRAGEFFPVAGGWADAADYLQYVTTSANATFVMLMAYRDHPQAFADVFGRARPAGRRTACPTSSTRRGTGWSGWWRCSPRTA